MNNNRLNIIKHIEEKEGKDIWDYKVIDINTKVTKVYYNNYNILSPENMGKHLKLEYNHNKIIENKSQIYNRIQYMKQSGYVFKNYSVVDDMLTIVFE